MTSLPTALRRQLGNAIIQARNIAQVGARKALEALAVHEPDSYQHMNEAQRDLRRKLRAQAKQLGDSESQTRRGAYAIQHLVEKLAYDQWHRLLFARFLLENNLLISPEHGVAVSLDDCEELAPSFGLRDAWSVAARFAARELPQIFRADDPAGAVELPVEDRNPLIQLVTGLPVEVFTAGDSLGWCYQFWQAERKDEVNDAGNKIGADELPAVTQLFTEDYMVDFLLDNTLGAWHAGKVLAANPSLVENAQTEEELRDGVALPGCPWKYLRFIRAVDGNWMPAAGPFDGWPKIAKELTCLDPCMGSGHFVVAMFDRLLALRVAEEKLDESVAVLEVIRDNLFGLEIDPRCTQIGAFNLALAAWRRVGHCELPAMNLACSGLAPRAKQVDWLKLAGDNEKLRNGMERLYLLFQDAPVLGSLIDPRAAEGDLLVAAFHELQPLLEKALSQETKDDTTHEMAVTAQGVAKAAEILAGRFTLVATNVPYLGRLKQAGVLKDYCGRVYKEAKADLAACFVERSLEFCAPCVGALALVTPQIWLFLTTYTKLRRKLLRDVSWNILASLGEEAWWTFGMRGPRTVLTIFSATRPKLQNEFFGIDVSTNRGETPIMLERKAACLSGSDQTSKTSTFLVSQSAQLRNPDASIVFQPKKQSPLLSPGGFQEFLQADRPVNGDQVPVTEEITPNETRGNRLSNFSTICEGISRGDTERFDRAFWEMPELSFGSWQLLLESSTSPGPYAGRNTVFLWESGTGEMALSEGARVQGLEAWGKNAIFVSRTHLKAFLTDGAPHAQNGVAIIPRNEDNLGAIWSFCNSEVYRSEVLKLNQKLIKPTGALGKVPFDLNHWHKVAEERYPHGLPKPFSADPTQWLFNGHPNGSDQPLHVALARLLGYRWPRQTGASFPDCPALGSDGIEKLADEDGMVCLSATKGEAAAAERLRVCLVHALGEFDLATLIADAGPKGSKSETLDNWLRDEFFEQHCALFGNRPFIWHIWDGHKSGFSALVNYHRLTQANLTTLTYAHLGDWIRRQQAAVDAGEAGRDIPLQAAKQLQTRLKLILEGEPPFDLFVRWKPLSKQAIGWHPDINDGVRMNIRPFANADILRKRVKVKWEKDRGKEPSRDKKDFPWLWGWDEEKLDFAGVGKEPDGNRWNDCHYTNEFKKAAREANQTR